MEQRRQNLQLGSKEVSPSILRVWGLRRDASDPGAEVQVSSTPEALAPFEKETSVEGRGGGLQAAVFFPSSLWLEKRRPGGHRHGFQKIVRGMTYPTLDQWVTSFFSPNSQMKFQVSRGPARSAAPIGLETFSQQLYIRSCRRTGS